MPNNTQPAASGKLSNMQREKLIEAVMFLGMGLEIINDVIAELEPTEPGAITTEIYRKVGFVGVSQKQIISHIKAIVNL